MFQIIVIPFIGAFIGWITNVLAIRLIFWPYEPKKIPFINFEIQGLIPKRRMEIAASVAKIIERELLSSSDVADFLTDEKTKNEISALAYLKTKEMIDQNLPKYIPLRVKKIVTNPLEQTLKREIPQIIDSVSIDIGRSVHSKLDLYKIAEERMNNLEMSEMEELIVEVAEKELGHIKIVGAILGFLIGLVQVVFISFFIIN